MNHMHPDDIRTLFSSAMSELYRKEVPQYGTLCDLVSAVNERTMNREPELAVHLRKDGQLERLEVERHGAIRLGTEQELGTIRRMFAVMGMMPVGYYDLSAAGVPVHSTAFRPISDASLGHNPFRVFTSLLRLELIQDEGLRRCASSILARRHIFSARCLDLLCKAEAQGGLEPLDACEFVSELLSTFRWHREATVDLATYRELRAAHALVADIVCFKGPHINHLTPRTLDIDAVQGGMREAGLSPKDHVEGPPRRTFPILLRQTSFLALEENIRFVGEDADGTHTARFGEVEQRGCALTRKGRALYDQLLAESRSSDSGVDRQCALEQAFRRFPDDPIELFREGLAFFRFQIDHERLAQAAQPMDAGIMPLVESGCVRLDPIIYEDFLPVSAAGIFRSNLGSDVRDGYAAHGNQAAFEAALGTTVMDEIALYENAQATSLAECEQVLSAAAPAWSV